MIFMKTKVEVFKNLKGEKICCIWTWNGELDSF